MPLDTLLPRSLAATDEAPADAEWRSVVADGRYLPDGEFIVVNRSQDGIAGDMTVTPLQLDDGRILLVKRGFVPVGASRGGPGTERRRGGDRPAASQPGATRRASSATPPTGVITEAQQFDIPASPRRCPARSCRCTSS